jgi:hypothetical protein
LIHRCTITKSNGAQEGGQMGDRFQTIVDPEAAEAETPALAASLLQWLIDEGIVVAQESDCALADEGYAPGPSWSKATGPSDYHLQEMRANGLQIVVKHNVFHNGGLGFEIVCDSCGGRFEPPDGSWGDAVGEWYDHSGPGLLACPGCKAVRMITDWRHDPNIGFANLGFEFWNWPPLLNELLLRWDADSGTACLWFWGRFRATPSFR